jgi:hypothetical protein
MATPSVVVRLRGPFFSTTIPPVIVGALNDAIGDLVTEGEGKVKLQLYPGHGLITGHYRRSIHGEIASSLHGRIHDSKVIYGPWLEGVSSRNQTTRFKGFAMFRNARQQLDRIAAGVLQNRVSKALARLR